MRVLLLLLTLLLLPTSFAYEINTFLKCVVVKDKKLYNISFEPNKIIVSDPVELSLKEYDCSTPLIIALKDLKCYKSSDYYVCPITTQMVKYIKFEDFIPDYVLVNGKMFQVNSTSLTLTDDVYKEVNGMPFFSLSVVFKAFNYSVRKEYVLNNKIIYEEIRVERVPNPYLVKILFGPNAKLRGYTIVIDRMPKVERNEKLDDLLLKAILTFVALVVIIIAVLSFYPFVYYTYRRARKKLRK